MSAATYQPRLRRGVRSYIYEKDIGVAYNRNFVVREEGSKRRWVGKVSRSLQEKSVNFQDLNTRAIAAHRLARVVGLPVLPWRVVPVTAIDGLTTSLSWRPINDEVFLTRYFGQTLPEFLRRQPLTQIAMPQVFIDNFVFNVWIGNHDRKDSDYLVGKNRSVYCIDYHLWGPGFENNRLAAVGAYAEMYSLEDPHDIGWCIGSPELIHWVREEQLSLKLFESMIRVIEQTDPQAIIQVLNGLVFTNEKGTADIRQWCEEYLIIRRRQIRQAIHHWIAAGYPKGPRPKDPAREDHIYTSLSD